MKFLKSITAIFGATVAVAAPLDQAAQKTQFESLLSAAVPFAEQMLKKHGEYFPFGATMSADGKVSSIGGHTGGEHPKSAEVISLLKEGYRKDALSGKILACALVYDVRIAPPGKTEKSDAIAIDLDHRDGLSITMYYPYRITQDKQLVIGEAFAVKGDDEIFPRAKKD